MDSPREGPRGLSFFCLRFALNKPFLRFAAPSSTSPNLLLD